MAKNTTRAATPGRADALAAAVNPPPLAAVTLESIADFRKLSVADLAARIKSTAATVASAHVLTGKMVHVMDDHRAGKGTLKAYIRKE